MLAVGLDAFVGQSFATCGLVVPAPPLDFDCALYGESAELLSLRIQRSNSRVIIADFEKNKEQMKAIDGIPWGVMYMLVPVVAASLLSGCAMSGSAQSSCRVFDPDLAQSVYTGGCKDGLADGYGVVSGAGSYRGDFRAGKKHGKGIKMMPNGDRYAGDFRDDYRHGKGAYVWGASTPWAGDRYEGEYRHDLRHGWGVFQWGSGDRYEGPWQDDLRMGPSVMELRRARAGEAAARSVKVGALVCIEAQLGLVNRQRMSGKIEEITSETVRVRIVAVEGGVASYSGGAVKAGDVLSDKAAHWQLCGQN